MSVPEEDPPPLPSNEQSPLSYRQGPQPVSLRGFRLLLFLTLVNTILLGGFVMGPALSAFGKQQWADYQRRQAAERAEVAKIAKEQAAAAARQVAMVAEQKCFTHAWPMGTLLYDDDPKRPGGPEEPAGKRGQDGKLPSTNPSVATPQLPWPWVTPLPEAFQSVASSLPSRLAGRALSAQTLLFMHERRASQSSEPRLVVVLIDATFLLNRSQGFQHGRRDVSAIVLHPTSPTTPMTVRMSSEYNRTEDSGDPYPPLRLFAGVADSADVTRFYIPYEMAGKSGMIVGRLQGDDTVHLRAEGPLASGWHLDLNRPYSP
jgi:hypothetical protein